jgi:hypothetical protein
MGTISMTNGKDAAHREMLFSDSTGGGLCRPADDRDWPEAAGPLPSEQGSKADVS